MQNLSPVATCDRFTTAALAWESALQAQASMPAPEFRRIEGEYIAASNAFVAVDPDTMTFGDCLTVGRVLLDLAGYPDSDLLASLALRTLAAVIRLQPAP